VTVPPKHCVEVSGYVDIIDPTDPLNVVPFTATMTAQAKGPITQFDGSRLDNQPINNINAIREILSQNGCKATIVDGKSANEATY